MYANANNVQDAHMQSNPSATRQLNAPNHTEHQKRMSLTVTNNDINRDERDTKVRARTQSSARARIVNTLAHTGAHAGG